MVVGDQSLIIRVVCEHLKDVGYRSFVSTTDPTEAMDILRLESPDLIALDAIMPGMDGIDLLQLIRRDADNAYTPVVVSTAAADVEVRLRALEAGATDCLTKPIDPSELVLRIRNALTAESYHGYVRGLYEHLDENVRQRTRELELARREAILCLARAAEYRDQETAYHVVRVGEYAAAIAQELGMEEDRIEVLKLAAQLHDVGKIGVWDTILLKPGKLDADEFTRMKEHCQYGVEILESFKQREWRLFRTDMSMDKEIMDACSSPIMRMGSIIAKTHHEKWDGTGYPLGLSGEDIPIEGRITAPADVFDALSSRRPYKEPLPLRKCLSILEEGRATHFDPKVLDAFFSRKEEIQGIRARYSEDL